jgi:fumarylacetoacetase
MGSMIVLDHTHDPKRQSFVLSANGHSDFPIQNLPLGMFSPGGGEPRAGVAIGDRIFDLPAAVAAGLLEGQAREAAQAASGATLNAFLALGAGPRQALRIRLSELLVQSSPEQRGVETCLHAASECTLHLPARIGDYTDFYVGIHHASNVGKQFRPDNPLLPNYKFVPIGRAAKRSPRMHLSRTSAQASGSIMSWSSASGWVLPMDSANRSASMRHPDISPVTAC